MAYPRIKQLSIVAGLALFLTSCDNILQTNPSTINGEWKCEETHYETGKSVYNIYIDYTDSTKNDIHITNFNNLSGYCKAKISGSYISIPKQTIDSHEIQGSGSISSDNATITFNYTDDVYGDGGGNVSTKCTRYQE